MGKPEDDGEKAVKFDLDGREVVLCENYRINAALFTKPAKYSPASSGPVKDLRQR